MTNVFYRPGAFSIVDSVEIIDGCERGMWSGRDLMLMQAQYPGIRIVDQDEALHGIQSAAIRPPIEINEEQYEDMLNVLPPVGWVRAGGASSFKMCERDVANITGIYCKIGGRYFELHDIETLRHDQIVDKVRAIYF